MTQLEQALEHAAELEKERDALQDKIDERDAKRLFLLVTLLLEGERKTMSVVIPLFGSQEAIPLRWRG